MAYILPRSTDSKVVKANRLLNRQTLYYMASLQDAGNFVYKSGVLSLAKLPVLGKGSQKQNCTVSVIVISVSLIY